MSNLKNRGAPRSHNRAIIQHGNEVSLGTAEPRERMDILDTDNGGPDVAPVMQGSPGSGSAPGAGGEPTTGGGSTVPYGMD